MYTRKNQMIMGELASNKTVKYYPIRATLNSKCIHDVQPRNQEEKFSTTKNMVGSFCINKIFKERKKSEQTCAKNKSSNWKNLEDVCYKLSLGKSVFKVLILGKSILEVLFLKKKSKVLKKVNWILKQN